MKKITFLFVLALALLSDYVFAQKIDTLKHNSATTKIPVGLKFATAGIPLPTLGGWVMESTNDAKTTLFQAVAKTDATGIGDHLFRFFGPNGPIFSVNAITPQNGNLITRFGTNYTVNGADGLTDYAYNAKKYATYIELDSDNGAISLTTEEGALSTSVAPARTISSKITGLCVKRGGIVQVSNSLGIGVTTPTAKLEVNSTIAGVSGIKLTQLTSSSTAAAANGKALSVDASGNVILVTAGSGSGGDNLGNHTATTTLNMNNQNVISVGSLGIGTASPSAKLEVNSGTIANAGLKFTQLNASSPTAAANGKALTVDASGNVILVPASTGSGTSYWTLNTANNNITNSNTGCVVIGSTITSFPTGAGYKLFVEGGILTERVKVAVKNTANWADYVFASNYRLRPLSEVAQHIQQYKHLPDVPSAQEVVNSGLDLAENQAKLLQKIEELTLYVIEQDKQIKRLQKQVKGLKK